MMNNLKNLTLYMRKLPFSSDASGYFLIWIMLVMVFFASMALAGNLVIGNMAKRWNASVSGSFVIQVLPPKDNTLASGDTLEMMVAEVDKAAKVLQQNPGVDSIKVLSLDELENLLKPWLGETALDGEFPIPRLIDVTLQKGANIDIEKLSAELKEVAPNAVVDVHRMWLQRFMSFVMTIDVISLIVLIMILLTTGISVIYAAITSLQVHRPAIELLHLIGAKDNYIAILFSKRTISFSFLGAVVGLLLALPAFVVMGSLLKGLNLGILGSENMYTSDYLMLASLPFIAGILSGVAAFVTIKMKLKTVL